MAGRLNLRGTERPVTATMKSTAGDGPLLLATREKHGLSQEDMGLLLGVVQSAITHLEKGRNKRLSKLARRECEEILGLTTDTVRRRLAAKRLEAEAEAKASA
jgi:DNA-binding XRE family transcriptional regulator